MSILEKATAFAAEQRAQAQKEQEEARVAQAAEKRYYGELTKNLLRCVRQLDGVGQLNVEFVKNRKESYHYEPVAILRHGDKFVGYFKLIYEIYTQYENCEPVGDTTHDYYALTSNPDTQKRDYNQVFAYQDVKSSKGVDGFETEIAQFLVKMGCIQ